MEVPTPWLYENQFRWCKIRQLGSQFGHGSMRRRSGCCGLGGVARPKLSRARIRGGSGLPVCYPGSSSSQNFVATAWARQTLRKCWMFGRPVARSINLVEKAMVLAPEFHNALVKINAPSSPLQVERMLSKLKLKLACFLGDGIGEGMIISYYRMGFSEPHVQAEETVNWGPASPFSKEGWWVN
ncbi:hypothetical protein Cgig2_027887 [Carnegiea gigantea]|uniref:Uncharacterized protein n=1 Tax=Carnegiea gigantea TaxID=171969 RepID=A0A9Q1KN59_9CARY|nr:hypothetical protein Cgig2_027887 [Carnegiea gigantea]